MAPLVHAFASCRGAGWVRATTMPGCRPREKAMAYTATAYLTHHVTHFALAPTPAGLAGAQRPHACRCARGGLLPRRGGAGAEVERVAGGMGL